MKCKACGGSFEGSSACSSLFTILCGECFDRLPYGRTLLALAINEWGSDRFNTMLVQAMRDIKDPTNCRYHFEVHNGAARLVGDNQVRWGGVLIEELA